MASSAVVRDFVGNVLRVELDDRRTMRLARAVGTVLGVLAVLLARMENRILFWFVLFSWGGPDLYELVPAFALFPRRPAT